jgi:aryl-alcohol dehydrogenase-like predicted oxidoreductase
MQLRQLGTSEIRVPPLCLGSNVFGWTADEKTSFTILDALIAAGLNFVDTADVYSTWVPGHQGGESETIIGKWMKRSGNRRNVIVATKVGMDMGPAGKGLSRQHIFSAVERSLERLQTDYIDLYQSHQDDPGTPLEETLDAYAELIKQGKVRAIGASNYTAERLAAALQTSETHGYPRYVSLQPHYNLYERAGYEAELEPLCEANHLGVIPYFSLAKGFLTGKYRSQQDLGKSPRGQGVKQYLDARGLRILSALDEVAQKLQSTPAQVSLAWLMARPSVTAPIASATTVEQLQDLVRATQVQLDPASIQQLDEASAWKTVAAG